MVEKVRHMTTEYHLQKRMLATWQYVTWYDNLDQAKLNFNVVSKEDNGYSWRLVEVVVIEERLLNDVRKMEPDDNMPVLVKDLWKPVQPVNDPWAAKSSWGNGSGVVPIDPQPSHGLTGSVWVGNPKTKEKRRVVGFEANKLLAEGWIKAGPRTVL